MIHQIKNSQFVVEIESLGAEIRSMKSLKTGKEYIWPMDAKVWGSSSPVLFPAIGKIKDDHILYKGQSYAMRKHGIIRNNDDLEFRQVAEHHCTFTLHSSEKTKLAYPFDFTFTVEYVLKETELEMKYVVSNIQDEPIYFAMGGHTAYYCPLGDGVCLNDYSIDFSDNESFKTTVLGADGMLSDVQKDVENSDRTIKMSEERFSKDALIFKNINSDAVKLSCIKNGLDVDVVFKGYPNVALWSKPGADYVCIEPWLGLPDRTHEPVDVDQKETYQKIDAGDTFDLSIVTRVNE